MAQDKEKELKILFLNTTDVMQREQMKNNALVAKKLILIFVGHILKVFHMEKFK